MAYAAAVVAASKVINTYYLATLSLGLIISGKLTFTSNPSFLPDAGELKVMLAPMPVAIASAIAKPSPEP